MSELLVQRVATKVVIEAEGAILALHPSEVDLNRNWQIPGGIRDDFSETLIETGVREVGEETGLDIGGMAMRVFKYGEWTAVDKGEKVGIVAVFFHVILPKRPDIVLSHEHDDLAWLTKANHKDYQANREVHEIVEELL